MQLPFECDDSVDTPKTLGLIVLSADETIEREFRSVFQKDAAALYHTRIESSPDVTPETLMLMKDRLTDAARLLPANTPMSVIGYACTSGATVIGEDAVAAAVRKVHGTAEVTNPASAVVAALRHLNVTRVGVVSPYVADVSEAVCTLLRNNGLTPACVGSFGQSEEAIVARIALASVEEAICSVGADPQVEVVFASCTNLRTFPVIEACEARLGKPVISSNQALAWHMLTLAGLDTIGRGRAGCFPLEAALSDLGAADLVRGFWKRAALSPRDAVSLPVSGSRQCRRWKVSRLLRRDSRSSRSPGRLMKAARPSLRQ